MRLKKTNKGHDYFLAISALQKSIRRGELETACFFATDLFMSGYEEALWERLKIITSEDIGLGDPHMPATIASLYDNFVNTRKSKKDNRPERIFLMNAVVLLVKAPKSRLTDYAMIVSFRSYESVTMEIPDYAYDKHTIKGKQMGRGWDHFFTEGVKLENEALQLGEKEMAEQAREWVEKVPGKLSFKFPGKQTELDF